MLGLMGVFSFDILALECMKQDQSAAYVFFNTVYLWCIIPVAMSIVTVVIGVVRSMYATSSDERGQIKSQHVWCLLFLSYLVLPSVSSKQLKSLDCVAINNENYVRSETSINCSSNSYLEFRAVVVIFIVLYQLVPILWTILLAVNRELLNPPLYTDDELHAVYVRDNNPSLFPLRFLFVDYKPSCWWFEIADMYRRIVLIGLLPLSSSRPSMRASLGFVLAVFSVILFRELKPYRDKFVNFLAYIAQVLFNPLPSTCLDHRAVTDYVCPVLFFLFL
jgi:hypothetical protein